MNKKSFLLVCNLFFIALAICAVCVFLNKKDTFDAHRLVQDSIFKEKTFQADVKEVVSQKGIKAWLLSEKSVPIVALDFRFKKSGYAFDRQGKFGLAMLTAGMLEYGATQMNNDLYHNLLEENGIEFGFDVSAENFNISMVTPTENLSVATDLLKRILTKPVFKNKNLELMKKRQSESLKMKKESPEKMLAEEVKKTFYGNHPKARDSYGKIEDINKIGLQDLYAFVSKHFVSDQLVVAMAGDISVSDAKFLLDEVFGSLKTHDDVQSLEKPEPNYIFEEHNIERKMPQVLSSFLAEGTKRSAQDFYALYIANEIFGGSGLSSRLNLAAREKEGLTYGAYTYLDPQKDAPSIRGGFATSKQNYGRMKEILLQEWQKMAESGVSAEEFQAIKDNMLTSFNLRFQSISDIAAQLLYMQKENLGIDFLQKRNDYVKNVTLDEVNAAAKKYFKNLPSMLTIGNN